MAKDILKVTFIKDCMADALEKLMETRPLKDISIEEITSLAGVGRVTYFRNFDSKYEVVAYKRIKDWFIWRDKYNLEPSETFNYEGGLNFFRFQKEFNDYIKSEFLDSSEYMEVYRIICKYVFTPKVGAEEEDSYKISFFSYGVIGLLMRWRENGFKETPEQMAAYASKWFK